MPSTVDRASEVEAGQLEPFLIRAVGLLKENSSYFIGFGQVLYNLQFGDGKAFYVELEH